ncbi:MAG: hypothetical protein IJD42_04970 [Clostridia bacterium]|nr:hypothetical protein [Clostridia bacterium]
MEKVKCPICDTLIDDNPYDTVCPVCEWTYTGAECVYEENEKDDFNLISRAEAKANYKNGLTKYKKPIKK